MLHLHWGGSIEHGKEMHGSFRPSAHSLGLSTRPLKNRGSLAKSQGYRHLGWSGDASKIVFHFFFFFKWVRGAFHRWHCCALISAVPHQEPVQDHAAHGPKTEQGYFWVDFQTTTPMPCTMASLDILLLFPRSGLARSFNKCLLWILSVHIILIESFVNRKTFLNPSTRTLSDLILSCWKSLFWRRLSWPRYQK